MSASCSVGVPGAELWGYAIKFCFPPLAPAFLYAFVELGLRNTSVN